MSGLRLFQNGVSPFARKVRAVVVETGQQDDIEMVEMAGNAIDPFVSATNPNPLGKIPTLERPDGPALFDSRVICRFLDARAGGKLYPQVRLWDVLALEALADGILDAAVAIVYEKRYRDEEKWSDAWMEGQWSKIARALDALEARWTSHLTGPVDMGQIAVACALAYLDLRIPEREWRRGHDTLAAWEGRISARACLDQTKPV